MTTYTLPFAEIDASRLPQVGGKGANLGEMTRAGFPVPPGFCVTTEAFRAFMEAAQADSSQAESIYARLDALAADDLEGVRAAGAAIRAQLKDAPIPAPVAAAIIAAWQAQGSDFAYAVRSSATAEDLPEASFAGQQDTFLNVRGQDELLARVRDCWVSLFTDRAILYRAQNGFAHREVQLAVVVQQMVEPEVSGILFTADPVSGHRGCITINAGYGLGEALVGGLVTPDLYLVDKRSGQIIDVQVGDKQLAIRPAPGGGVVREAIQGAARTQRVLDDAQVQALAALGTRVESHYGAPQDIEWALAGGRLFLLQTRPITSLFPLPEPRPTDSALHVYFSVSHAQVMTDPMPPFACSVWRLVFPFGKPGPIENNNPYVATAAGRLYLDITPLLLMPKLGKLLPRFIRAIVDALSGAALQEVVARPEFWQDAEARRARVRNVARWLAPLYGKALARLLLLPPEGAARHLNAYSDAYIARASRRLAAADPGAPRLRVARRLLATALATVIKKMAPYLAAGIQARMLLGLMARRLGMAEAAEAVGRGLSGNVTTEM
ncbi:MAG TPA: PEP/pyruvate-binding domain-containing protein, partial [Caldilineaceae bacterium]|nr:PEP/pyruvate-binding domain-containing protein [Caldilineaceae bacterium]